MKKLTAFATAAVAACAFAILPACGGGEEGNAKLSEEEWRAVIAASAAADNYTYTTEQFSAFGTSQWNYSYHTFGTAYIALNELFFELEVLETNNNNYYDDMSGYEMYLASDSADGVWNRAYNMVYNDGVSSGWTMSDNIGSDSLSWTTYMSILDTLLTVEYSNADGERIGTIEDIYDYVTYDEATDTYSAELGVAGLYDSDGQFIENTAEGLRHNMTFAFEGGYISAFSMSYGDGTSIPQTQMSCTFSNYGNTSIELPEDLVEFMEENV